MIEIDTWVAGGYKVRAFDWVDGKNIYLNICYYCPGSSLSKPPAADRSFLLPMDMESTLRNYLRSVVEGLMSTPSNSSNNMTETVITTKGSMPNEASPESGSVEKQTEPAMKKDSLEGFLPCRSVPERWTQLLSALHRKTGHNGVVYTVGSAASELAIECGWSGKSSVYTGLKALCDCGAIRQVKRGTYYINPQILQSGRLLGSDI